jgi:hypothetical protein
MNPNRARIPLLLVAACMALDLRGQTPEVPDWALPGSATHHQVPPPADFHRQSRTYPGRIGIFEGQSDVGGAVVPGSATYDAATGRYVLNSAGYNIWYTRDEFRFLWRKLSGDLSLAASITFPNPGGYSDRKVVLIVRQDLDDDSREAMVALHGRGLIHLAARMQKGAWIKEVYKLEPKGSPGGPGAPPIRIGIEKRGDTFSLYVSLAGEPMHPEGSSVDVHMEGPFYAGIGFTSHLPAESDTAVVSGVVFETSAGKVR